MGTVSAKQGEENPQPAGASRSTLDGWPRGSKSPFGRGFPAKPGGEPRGMYIIVNGQLTSPRGSPDTTEITYVKPGTSPANEYEPSGKEIVAAWKSCSGGTSVRRK